MGTAPTEIDELVEKDLAASAPPPGPALTTPAPAQSPGEAFDALRSLFANLVPPTELVLTDCWGKEYKARAVLPARAQILVMQELHKLWEKQVSLPTNEAAMAAMAGRIVLMASDPEILDGISAAFTAAHPKVVAEAMADDIEGVGDIADVFPVEELVAGLIPFFVRFVARAADLYTQVTTPATA